MWDAVTLHCAEEMLVNQVADGDLALIHVDGGQFRGDATREVADLLVRAPRMELFIRVLAGKLVLAGSPILRLKRIGPEPERDCDPESYERRFDNRAAFHNHPFY